MQVLINQLDSRPILPEHGGNNLENVDLVPELLSLRVVAVEAVLLAADAVQIETLFVLAGYIAQEVLAVLGHSERGLDLLIVHSQPVECEYGHTGFKFLLISDVAAERARLAVVIVDRVLAEYDFPDLSVLAEVAMTLQRVWVRDFLGQVN